MFDLLFNAMRDKNPMLPFAITAGVMGFLIPVGLFKNMPLLSIAGVIYVGYIFYLKYQLKRRGD